MGQRAYIVTGFRSAVGKAGKGGFRFYRPDDLAADVIKHLMASVPELDKLRVDDVIVGNATPEAEQGLNVGRMISLMGLNTDKVPGMTVNRYCSSGLETIAIATAKIEELIDDLKEKFTIIIVTHSMQQAARVSHRTAFFHLGKVIEYDTTDKIFTNPSKKETQDYITGRFG